MLAGRGVSVDFDFAGRGSADLLKMFAGRPTDGLARLVLKFVRQKY